ncbi:TPA: site-specific DNA-methyltransferase, partial [Escherichia coli]
DDSELSNIKITLDEIFGGENYLATLVWDRNRKNDAKYFSVGHEYMLVYARNESYLTDSEIIFRGAKEGVDYLQDLFNKSKLKHGDNWDLIKKDVFDYYKSISKDDPRAPLKRFTKIDEKGP